MRTATKLLDAGTIPVKHEVSILHDVTADILPRRIPNICCLGAGYVGGPTSAILASKNPDIIVQVVDRDQERIDAWNSNDLPIREPNLLPLVQTARDASDGRLSPNLIFSTNIRQAIHDADIIFIAVNTPLKSMGRGAGQALDIRFVESAAESIAKYSTSDKIIVEKSTVPCGTSKTVHQMLASLGRPGVSFDVLSNPEFLAEGTAVTNLLHPDRILIGSEQTDRGKKAARLLRQIYSWVSSDRILFMNVQSAELAKLTANAMLAQRISSINAISAICEESGADVEEVARACGLDPRIGSQMLKASLGFGGSCLGKDVATLAHYSNSLGLDHIAAYWKSVNQINEMQKIRFADRIIQQMNNTMAGKKIAIFGCAFKKDTADIRESAAISLLAVLIEERCHLSIYDPQVTFSSLLAALANVTGLNFVELKERLTMCESAYIACRDASAVVIATDWDEFSNKGTATTSIEVKRLSVQHKSTLSSSNKEDMHSRSVDWARIEESMLYPKLVFDGRNVVDGNKLTQLGFKVHQIGKTTSRGW